MSNLFRKKPIGQILSEGGDETSNPSLAGEEPSNSLEKTLTVKDLTAFGIAAIIGAGIFSAIGNAASSGGPAVSLLFIFIAITCGFSALCYAEFASIVPIAGSAYTYTYIAFGELFAWIIGWNLILEYAIGNIAVAISWSGYFTRVLSGFGIHIPEYLTLDYLTAMRGHAEAEKLIQSGTPLDKLPEHILEAFNAWNSAPVIGSFHLVANFTALSIVIFITWLVYIGMKESRTANNIMVAIKLLTLLAVIVVGGFYIKPENWVPFAPNGFSGVMMGVSAIFFAYIGFDAISTTAEECKNPQRDLPRGIIYALIITTILYVILSLVLTGVVNYTLLAVNDPLAFIFAEIGLNRFSFIISLSAIIAITSVLLVFQMGQPRIWMSMSRDGLLPKKFSEIHPKYKTPAFSTIITGLLVGIPTLFMNLTEVTDLTSIGTLFAFIFVCAGVIVLEEKGWAKDSKFKIPYINSRYIVPLMLFSIVLILYLYFPERLNSYFSFTDPNDPNASALKIIIEKIPMFVFIILAFVMAFLSYTRKFSLIPVLGLLSCTYLMTELGIANWIRFFAWLAIGMVIYIFYGYKSSKLNVPKNRTVSN